MLSYPSGAGRVKCEGRGRGILVSFLGLFLLWGSCRVCSVSVLSLQELTRAGSISLTFTSVVSLAGARRGNFGAAVRGAVILLGKGVFEDVSMPRPNPPAREGVR